MVCSVERMWHDVVFVSFAGASLAWMSSELLLATASVFLVEIAVRGPQGPDERVPKAQGSPVFTRRRCSEHRCLAPRRGLSFMKHHSLLRHCYHGSSSSLAQGWVGALRDRIHPPALVPNFRSFRTLPSHGWLSQGCVRQHFLARHWGWLSLFTVLVT